MKQCLAILFLFLASSSIAQSKKEITLEDVFAKGTFKQDAVSGFRSMKDGIHYSEINEEKKLVQVRFQDGKEEGILADFKEIQYKDDVLKIDDYAFNEEETKLLLFTESENIYRRSVLHKVYVYDIQSKEVMVIKDAKILHAAFSPKGDKVAYVFENNLYYMDLNSMETVAITDDGDYNSINGNCDWVYEEEFEFTKAYEWSAEGDYIAYYHFDQSAVPEYNYAIYDKLYPTDYRFKYPKAGEKNSTVSIFIYQLRNDKTSRCDIGDETDMYIPRIKINPFNNALIIYRMNRLQNQLEFLQADTKTGITKIIYTETNKYYIEVNDDIVFFKNRNAFVHKSEKDGYNHIYLQDIEDNHSSRITTGEWDDVRIFGVDEKQNTIYYLSAEKSPMDRNLYTIATNGENKKMISTEKGWHDISFSEGFQFYMDKFSYLNHVPVYTIHNDQGNLIRTLKSNESLEKKMKEYTLSKLELIQVPNEDGVLLNAWMLKPADFSESKKYPLLMFQYSGPGSQQVTNQFAPREFWWYQMLAQKGYVIVCADGTGTGFRGEEFKKKTYLQLGKYESDDQIAVAKYFANQPYIDAKRIGIWGWSFGGYMSSICILKGADVFKSAIAVAPVTNWRYYDNIYTERYMRTPQENGNGYDDNSPVTMTDKLKGKYLLIHGTADDNVHFQNSVMMVDALIKSNKDFDSEYYPNKNHGISGGVTRLQLYRRLTRFILEDL